MVGNSLWSIEPPILELYSVYNSLCPAASQMSIKSTLGCQLGACSNADHKTEDLKLLKVAQRFLVFPVGVCLQSVWLISVPQPSAMDFCRSGGLCQCWK